MTATAVAYSGHVATASASDVSGATGCPEVLLEPQVHTGLIGHVPRPAGHEGAQAVLQRLIASALLVIGRKERHVDVAQRRRRAFPEQASPTRLRNAPAPMHH